jgi:multiple sugar transport system ATP-binding protein
VRAEDVISGSGASAKVDVIERLGERTLIYAMLKDGSTIVYDEPGDARVRIGDAVQVAIDGGHAHLFDQAGRAYLAMAPAG